MLSYRHSYHAGNFADVLKHLVLQRILAYMIKKDAPLLYLDTHSAAGAYALDSESANKTREYENGIGHLWEQYDLPEIVEEYVELIRKLNPDGQLQHYPGSPWFAQQLLRKQDRIALYELHSNEVELLRNNVKGDRRIKVFAEDGFQGCVANMPPKERRGLILIDPPYEIKKDYQETVKTLTKAHRRFATGTYALWYPVVDRYRIRELHQSLVDSGMPNIHYFELGLEPDNTGFGMTASGMVVINPPWTLKAEMETALPYLAEALSPDGWYKSEQLVAE